MPGPIQRGRPRGAAPITTTSTLWLAALTAASACDTAPPPGPPPGQVRFAIAADTCDAYCITAVRVTLYEEGDDLPLGPALQASCASADALVFTTLPAGLRVEAAVEGFDLTGDTLLTGRSAPVTIAASRRTDLTIQLTATVRPSITAAEPDPIAPSLTPTLTVSGEHLGPLGDYGLLLDDRPLSATFTPASDDGLDQVTASLAALSGSLLTARRCGVTSAPYPLRVAADTPGSATVNGLPLCGGAPVGMAHSTSHTAIAWRCDTPATSQLVLMTDGPNCPLDPLTTWSLGDAPTGPIALSPSTPATVAWVALPDTVLRVELATGATTSLPVAATSLATTATTTWAIAEAPEGDLVELHDQGTTTPRPDLFPELDFVALAAAPPDPTDPTEPTDPTDPTGPGDRLWVASTAAGSGQGRLVAIPATGTPTAYPLPCAPTALAASKETVALACPTSLVLWDVASSTSTSLDLSPRALALPSDAADTVFALTASGLTLVDLVPSPTIVLTTPLSADSLIALTSHRILARDGAALRVLTPYDAMGPCP